MDDTTFRILDTLSRELGKPISINELTKKIEKLHGKAYYKNIYDKLHTMANNKIITLTKSRNSSLVSLNFTNYLLIDLLAQMELVRKQNFLQLHRELQMLFLEIDTYFKDLHIIQSISAINLEYNINLNRVELLILLRNIRSIEQMVNATLSIYRLIGNIQSIHNIRIDYLLLSVNEFIDLLKSDEANPLKEMMIDKITLLFPQAFWLDIREAVEKGIRIQIGEPINLTKISEDDLVYNLARFGYKEIGPEIKGGKDICIEYIVTSILLQDDARRIDAIPIILAKRDANYNLLIFLSQKYGLSDKLLGLLKVLNKLKPKKEVGEAIRILESINIKEAKANEESIREKMRLYNVIR